MSHLHKIMETMHPDCWYSAKDMAARLHCSEGYARQCLRMLASGELCDVRKDEEYKLRKQYRSKQRKLFA